MSKVVLVTGSSRGIGAATIKEFASHGYNVVINYVNSEDKALELKKYVETKYNVKALVSKCDISNEFEVKHMVEETIDTFGHIDVLVNNAGIAMDTDFENKTVDNFRKILDINLIGTFIVSRTVGEYMLKEKQGVITNVISNNAIDAYYPMGLDYDASKAGEISLTHNLALQYAPYIRVNGIAPGWVNTDVTENLESDFKKKEMKKIILNRFAEPEEIAKTIYFLSSDKASYINNSIIRVDGGFNA